MRLTLRTMLAYLDGILEPADREEIGRKIEESDFARQLAQRLRDCLRNPDLAAPRVSGKATGLDPNLVAEYLDNTLAGERVPEFEKLCLESDVFLAEVAACHQILTMVLGQPAEIDLEMKQHMYGVPSEASHRTSQPEMVNVAADNRAHALPDELWVKTQRRKPEIPDYLRESPKRKTPWKPIAAAGLLLVILAVAITLALGPLDRTHPIARLLGFGAAPENPAAAANQQDNNAAAADNNGAAASNESAKSEPSDNGADAAQKSTAEKSTLTIVPTDAQPTAQNANPAAASASPAPGLAGGAGADASAASTAPAAPLPTDHAASTTDSSTAPPPIPQPPANNSAAPAPSPDVSHTASDNATATTMPPTAATSTAPTSNGATSAAQVPGDTTMPKPASITDAAPAPPAQPVLDSTPLGRLLPSKDVVLLKFDTAAGQWARVATGAAVTAGEQLLVLPTYRPTITLSAGITLQIPDETLLELQSPDGHGVPTVKLVYGRLIAITTGKAGAQLGLDVGGVRGVVSFADADATLAVEVRRFCAAGTNPEVDEPHVATDLYAARGHLQWLSADGVATDLAAPQRWVLSTNPAEAMAAPAAAPNLPKWIDPEQLRSYDAHASDYLAQSLQDDKPLLVALGEMVDHRRVEIKSMGAQCLALLDEFEPLVASFNDSESRPMWAVDIASVKAAIARGPATAAKVHQAFVKQRGDDLGKNLYRMFLGYTKDQLQNGEAAKLVDFLDHDNLDCRVLAFANLQEITNKTFNYRPESPAASRAQPLHRWQEELRTNAIVPRDNPAK
jgi:hypothetical protein